MPVNPKSLSGKVALVTGAAKRLGAASVKALHTAGANVVVHYHHSENSANQLVSDLNALRAGSAASVGTQLGSLAQAQWCIQKTMAHWGRLDIVVNNASSFFPTPFGEISDEQVADLMSSNVSAPLFITQSAQSELAKQGGCVVNMVDIHGLNPYKNHSVYSAAKAAMVMLTRSMAQELAPHIRVNAIAPGAILWPEDGSMSEELQALKLSKIPLGRQGTPDDIANLVVYLCCDEAAFITGEVIKVDGGNSI